MPKLGKHVRLWMQFGEEWEISEPIAKRCNCYVFGMKNVKNNDLAPRLELVPAPPPSAKRPRHGATVPEATLALHGR